MLFASTKPIIMHSFNAPEMWLVLQSLGVVLPNTVIPVEIGKDQTLLDQTKQAMNAAGVFSLSINKELDLAPEIKHLVSVSVRPENILVVSKSDAQSTSLTPVRIFSWSSHSFVANWVKDGHFFFESYLAEESKAQVLNYLSNLCHWERDLDNRNAGYVDATNNNNNSVKEVILLMATLGVTSDVPQTSVIAWFVHNGQIWLSDQTSQSSGSANNAPLRGGLPQLVLAIFEMIENLSP